MPTHLPRRRVRELPRCQQPASRLAEEGLAALSIQELLALVLGTPDALDQASELLAILEPARLLHAHPDEIQAVRGIGPARARQVAAAIALGGRLQAWARDRPAIACPSDAGSFLVPLLGHLEVEHMVVVLLTTKRAVLDVVWLYRGSLNSSVVRPAELFREAIRRQAAAILVAHNHPSGDPTPSAEDMRVTTDLRSAGEMLGIDLVDHLIVGGQRYLSMRERGHAW